MFGEIIGAISNFMYSYLLIIMLIGVGLYYTLRTLLTGVGAYFGDLLSGISGGLERLGDRIANLFDGFLHIYRETGSENSESI